MNYDTLQNKTILIVDDQPKNLDVLISSLEQYEFEFIVAQNGEEAIKRVLQVTPDIILLDILMPEMDGYEVCKQIKAIPDCENIPIIFMSALSETINKVKGFSFGAVDYITKPFQLDEIIARIKTHLTISELRHELHRSNALLETKVNNRTEELQNSNTHLQKEVSERKTLEKRYKFLLETLQEGVWLIDQTNKTSYANPRLASLLLTDVDELLQHTIFDFIPERLHLQFRMRLNPDFEQIGRHFDFTLYRSDGSYIAVSMACSPLFDDNNIYEGALIAVSDISKRKEAEKELYKKEKILQQQNKDLQDANERMVAINTELRKAIEKANESDRLKSAFLSNISHEIRTPMNAIIGFSDLLKLEQKINKTQEKHLEYVISGTQQLLDIITDIVDISKIEMDQYEFSLQEFNINAVIDDILGGITCDLEKKSSNNILVLTQKGLVDSAAYIESSEQLIRHVFKKILGNAVKFTKKGYIEFGYTINSNRINFYVKDTGIGIEKKFQKIIFEDFRQVEESYTRTYGGIGLGLPIAKGLIHLLGGDIFVESELDKGTTFHFSIQYTNTLYHEINPHVPYRLKPSDEIWNGKTILIAEDEEINVLYIRELLSNTGSKLLIAEDGEKAVHMFEKNPEIDLILMDIKMPNMNGFEALSEIKKMSPNVPIIAQTAYAMSDDESRALKAGFDAYISKPIRQERLFELMIELLKG